MDHREPHSPTPESFLPPDMAEAPSQKTGWSLLDLFKPKPDDKTGEASRSETKAERAEHSTEQARSSRFGEAIIKLLGLERAKPDQPAVSTEQVEAGSTPVPQPEIQPTIVDRAKDMGRHVLRLIKGVREEVVQADQEDRIIEPTDIEPLDAAGEQVRAAMEELVEPSVKHDERTHQPHHAPETGVGAGGAEASDSPDYGGSQRPVEPVQRAMRATELAVALIAATVAERSERAEYAERPRHSGIIRKLGVLALGGALVYSLRRQHQIKKEQRARRKELKRFEAEVREEQAAAAERIRQLEQTAAEQLSQPKRQAYVREVSRFAVAQAAEIHLVAVFARQQQEVMPPVAPLVVEQLRLSERQQHVLRPEVPVLPLPPAERVFVERPPLLPVRKPEQAPERRRVAERVAEIITGRPALGGSAPQSGGLANRLFGVLPHNSAELPNNAPGQAQQTAGQQRTPTKQQPSQAWLLGVGLAVGVGVALIIAMGIL